MLRFGLASIVLLLVALSAFAQCKDEGCGLVIRGKVTDVEVERNSNENSLRYHVKLDVAFKNEGVEPIILFKPEPETDDRYWLGAWSLFVDMKGSSKPECIFSDGGWQSVSGGDLYKKLADDLDTKEPSPDFTRTLRPGEVWDFTDSLQIYFQDRKTTKFGTDRTWEELPELRTQPVKLRIAYELSPWNVEYFKPKLIKKLKKRWSGYGNVLVEAEKGNYSHFRHSSEFIELNFSKARERNTTVDSVANGDKH